MAFCMAIILFVIGYILIHKDDSGMSKADQKKWNELKKHPSNLPLEYLLFFGVYAYYAHQPRKTRPHPIEDAARHTAIEMVRRGYLPYRKAWWTDYQNLTEEDLTKMSCPRDYQDLATHNLPTGLRTLWKLTEGDNKSWPITPGPTATSWLRSTEGSDLGGTDFISYGYLYNRLTEWYYLVMFKDEYQRLGLNIEDVVLSEVRRLSNSDKLSSDYVDKKFAELMSEIQGIVYWGDKWDEEIRGFQRQKENYQNQLKRAEDEAEASAKQRRQALADGKSPSQPSLPTPDEMTPEWAKQQLKEKYGIDYDAADSR